MATPRPVSRKLREMLGAEAGQSMIDWLDGIDDRRRELRHDVDDQIALLRVDFAQLREEMRVGIAQLREEMRGDSARLREEMRVGFAAVDAKIEQRNANLLKWMIGFWLGSFAGIVGAMLALARIIR